LSSDLKKALRVTSYLLSSWCLLFILLAFTELPYWAYYGLAAVEDRLETEPQVIVVMGGDGMPSPSGLMRTYFGIECAQQYENAKVILALPHNDQSDSTYQLRLMAHEFVLKGIDSSRITFEAKGYNTHSQVEAIAKMIPDKNKAVLVVTSPEHMFRCLASFRKRGFKKVGGNPTFEKPSDEQKLKNKGKAENWQVRNLTLRYNIWSYMQYEIIVLREYAAISYYWMKGWI
jgi:uncharacterized SAM-binding protein YcdF (DUF218 family)